MEERYLMSSDSIQQQDGGKGEDHNETEILFKNDI